MMYDQSLRNRVRFKLKVHHGNLCGPHFHTQGLAGIDRCAADIERLTEFINKLMCSLLYNINNISNVSKSQGNLIYEMQIQNFTVFKLHRRSSACSVYMFSNHQKSLDISIFCSFFFSVLCLSNTSRSDLKPPKVFGHFFV